MTERKKASGERSMRDIVKDLFIVTDIDNAIANITFRAPTGCTAVAWAVLAGRKTVAKGRLRTTARKKVAIDAHIPDCRIWSITNPNLYTLKLTFTIHGKPQVGTERFGMRTIKAEGNAILVNNLPFFCKAYIRGREAHDHPNLENLSLYDFYAKNIRAAKDYGFNAIRFHSRIPPRECFEAADELGIFIHIEIRKYFGKYQKERAMMTDGGEIIDEKAWKAAVLELRNHPSLMVYCMGNEIRHPGTNPFIEHIANVTHKLDPTRLFIDTCAHGEFDRTYVDFDVQHMSYFYPFGKDYGMFENTQNWLIFGSCKGKPMVVQSGKNAQAKHTIKRAIPSSRPVLAHEICHYSALRDLDGLAKKFDRVAADQPWWISELKKLVAEKGLQADYDRMHTASRHWQFTGWKLGIEAARRSHLLCGYHFLQLADTDRYENSNGLLDCFDDKTGVPEKAFLEFNSDSTLLADLPRRTFFERETLTVPVLISHFSDDINGTANFRFALKSADGKAVSLTGTMGEIDLNLRGRREICRIELNLPTVRKPEALTLTLSLVRKGGTVLRNAWKLWLYPNKPDTLKAPRCTVDLDEINLSIRYPQIPSTGTSGKPEKLMIVNRFTPAVFKQLDKGGDVLMLYRVPETRHRKNRNAERETYYLPATWDRCKGIVWDRGHNNGAFVRKQRPLAAFPNEGFLDLQFSGLVNDSDKIVLDDFPVNVKPIMQGVDRAVRDRFDVYTFQHSELMPDWTMRTFAYLFEVKVGKGRLLVSGFNFTGLNIGVPETCAMFESLVQYVASPQFKPATHITADALRNYLRKKGRQPRARERTMTQYWQLNEEPIESDQYWKDAEAYIREGMAEEQRARNV